MRSNHMIAIASVAFSATAVADQNGVQFEVVLMRDGKALKEYNCRK
jgi:hypothetical protein